MKCISFLQVFSDIYEYHYEINGFVSRDAMINISVADPFPFDMDPDLDPRIRYVK